MHADKLTGMLLDAHILVKTIDVVPLLYSPKMVRLPSPSSRLAQQLQLTQLCTRAVLQLLDNIKEAKEELAASLARGDADPDSESLGGFKARAYSGPLSNLLSCFPQYNCCVYAMEMECACSAEGSSFTDIKRRAVFRNSATVAH